MGAVFIALVILGVAVLFLFFSREPTGNRDMTIAEFGARCDADIFGRGTDDTKAFQNAWNYYAAHDRDFDITAVSPTSRLGIYCRISALIQPPPKLSERGLVFVSNIFGSGANSRVLVSTVQGTECAITIQAKYGVSGNTLQDVRGFGLVRAFDQTNAGYGLCMRGLTKASVSHVQIRNFERCLDTVDTINFTILEVMWNGCSVQVFGRFGEASRPNAWVIRNNWFYNFARNAIVVHGPTQLTIAENDISAGGVDDDESAAVYIQGNPINGVSGATICENYFESNRGQADILIDQQFGSAPGIHRICNNSFNRDQSSQRHMIFLKNNGVGFTTIIVSGNGFLNFGAYVPSVKRRFIDVSDAAKSNYRFAFGTNVLNGAYRANLDEAVEAWPGLEGGKNERHERP